jgi:hypothetical protein
MIHTLGIEDMLLREHLLRHSAILSFIVRLLVRYVSLADVSKLRSIPCRLIRSRENVRQQRQSLNDSKKSWLISLLHACGSGEHTVQPVELR